MTRLLDSWQIFSATGQHPTGESSNEFLSYMSVKIKDKNCLEDRKEHAYISHPLETVRPKNILSVLILHRLILKTCHATLTVENGCERIALFMIAKFISKFRIWLCEKKKIKKIMKSIIACILQFKI